MHRIFFFKLLENDVMDQHTLQRNYFVLKNGISPCTVAGVALFLSTTVLLEAGTPRPPGTSPSAAAPQRRRSASAGWRDRWAALNKIKR